MTRKQCKEILKRYRTWQLEKEFLEIDLEFSEHLSDDKLRCLKESISAISLKINKFDKCVELLDIKEKNIIEKFIECNGRGYIKLVHGYCDAYKYNLLQSAIDKLIPILGPVFKD